MPHFSQLKRPFKAASNVPLLKEQLKDTLDALRPGRKRLKKLRAQWGQPGTGDGFLAEHYFELTGKDAGPSLVDDKTWTDLEFPQIFLRMDTTITLAGRQVLFHQLRHLDTRRAELENRHATRRKLAADAPLREKIQATLLRLKRHARSHLTDYLFGAPDTAPRHKGAWFVWSLACMAALFATALAHMPAWIWIAMLSINFVLILKTHWQVTRDNEAMVSCTALLHAADTLASLHAAHPDIPALARLHARRHDRARMRRALRLLATIKCEPIAWLTPWLNLTCAAELLLHACTVDRFFRLRESIAPDFVLVGELDAAIAIGSFLVRYPSHCLPEPANGDELVVVNGSHPLLPDGVTNSINLEQRSALVTGSNMAGKTTFIKMLGTNAIFAQTLGFCLATRARIPHVDVLASIQGSHSVASGKSHYFAEVERINAFFESSEGERRNLLVIDELFSGTNTTERVAIARAVLESLAKRAIVLATTHDVELQTFLGAHFDFFHFQEDPDVDGFFDYQLRRGTTRARNAIRMLGEMGFPAEVIARAMAYANQTAET